MIRTSALLCGLVATGCYMHHDGTPDRPDGGGSVCSSGFCGPGERCCELCAGEAACVGEREPCPDIVCPPLFCTSSFECADDEYCASEIGLCGGGECQPRPTGCFSDCPTVCGCDGATYCNVCEAARAGVSVRDFGSCESTGCVCSSGEYCDFGPECFENPFPVCSARPTTCPDVEAPVCGCDGSTYSNSCFAAAQGASVRHDGACGERENVRVTCEALCEFGANVCMDPTPDCADLCPLLLDVCTDEELERARACTVTTDCELAGMCLSSIECIAMTMG